MLTEPERLLVVSRVGFQTLLKLENKSVPVFKTYADSAKEKGIVQF